MYKRRNPLTYKQCTQTVTVYHKDGQTVTRQVFDRAYMDFRKVQTIDKTGSKDASSFLLVIPTNTPVVFVGDKAIMGEGPEVPASEWAKFIPANVPGLVVVDAVDSKYYGMELVHQEASG